MTCANTNFLFRTQTIDTQEFELNLSTLERSTLIHKRKTKMSDPRTAKVVVLGRSGVGKTCLAVRLIEGHFDNSEVSSH